MEQKYVLHIVTNLKMCSTITELLNGESVVLKMEPFTDELPVKTKSNHSFVGGKRFKGISGEDLILQSIPCSIEQLKSEFEKHGFAGSSYSSPMSKLKKEGKVKDSVKDGQTYYQARKV